MPDDLDIVGPKDRKTINKNQDHEIPYWTNKFDCTKKELIAAV